MTFTTTSRILLNRFFALYDPKKHLARNRQMLINRVDPLRIFAVVDFMSLVYKMRFSGTWFENTVSLINQLFNEIYCDLKEQRHFYNKNIFLFLCVDSPNALSLPRFYVKSERTEGQKEATTEEIKELMRLNDDFAHPSPSLLHYLANKKFSSFIKYGVIIPRIFESIQKINLSHIYNLEKDIQNFILCIKGFNDVYLEQHLWESKIYSKNRSNGNILWKNLCKPETKFTATDIFNDKCVCNHQEADFNTVSIACYIASQKNEILTEFEINGEDFLNSTVHLTSADGDIFPATLLKIQHDEFHVAQDLSCLTIQQLKSTGIMNDSDLMRKLQFPQIFYRDVVNNPKRIFDFSMGSLLFCFFLFLGGNDYCKKINYLSPAKFYESFCILNKRKERVYRIPGFILPRIKSRDLPVSLKDEIHNLSFSEDHVFLDLVLAKRSQRYVDKTDACNHLLEVNLAQYIALAILTLECDVIDCKCLNLDSISCAMEKVSQKKDVPLTYHQLLISYLQIQTSLNIFFTSGCTYCKDYDILKFTQVKHVDRQVKSFALSQGREKNDIIISGLFYGDKVGNNTASKHVPLDSTTVKIN